MDPLFESIDFNTSHTHAHFEDPYQELFRSTLEPVEKVLRDAKVDKFQVHQNVPVGDPLVYLVS